MNTLKWGVLGTANIAERSIIPAIQSTPGSELVAVASRDKAQADLFASQFGARGIGSYSGLLKNPDINAVYIPLPTGLHYEYVRMALENNKHVLVEKSAVTSYKEALDLVEISKDKNLALVENFQFQFHSQHQFVFDMLKQGTIGEIRCFRSSFGFPPFSVEQNIRYKKELGGGALLDAGAYVLRIVSFILGEGFQVKSAFFKMNKHYQVDWYGGGMLVNDKKNLFAQVAFGFDNYYQCNYEIWGSKGKITAERAFTAKPFFNPTIILETGGEKNEIILPADNHFNNMIKHFTDIIKNKQLEQEYKKILVQAKLISDFSKYANQ